ncbi:antibiotic biosynthesis monooxygenase [Nodosilinea nodulosa]|uniref:antibiotic biosynthesis monooxygenase n=1 Tax=Nodosilinea nodulosa TaxID=416001 RepID=UPI0003158D8B|nr:antibiotic biosynthesis monooxygenase [Nodosilinea nodulosa]
MVKGLGNILGACLLSLCLLLPSSPAWADKVATPMVFNAGDDAIVVLSLYETDPATQADAVKSFYKIAKSFYKTIPGFDGLGLFSSADGYRVVELSQWEDQASYETFQASLAGDGAAEDYTKYYEKYASAKGEKGKGKGKAKDTPVDLGEPFLTATFAVEDVVSPPGMVAAIPGSMAVVQISDITADSSDRQADLMAAGRAILADLPTLYPAPRTAVLLKGIDTPHIALLANWGSAAEFSDLDQIPTLKLAISKPEIGEADAEDTDAGLDEFAFTTDSHLYQTVKMIAPKPETYCKG